MKSPEFSILYKITNQKKPDKIVNQKANHDFVIVRPTSIWGPFFEIPYRTFFDTVRKNLFFIPKVYLFLIIVA